MEQLLPLPHNTALHSVPVNGVNLATFVTTPENHRADVLFIHGYTGSKEGFYQLAPLLAERGIRVIAFDHRGQNQSDHADPSTYTIAQLASDALAVADYFTMANAHVIGHSLGGLVAREVVLQSPERFESVTLLCSGAGPLEPMREGLEKTLGIISELSAAAAWNELVRLNDPLIPISIDADPESFWAKRWLNSDIKSVVAQTHVLLEQPDLTDEFAKTNIEKHVVYGDSDDAWSLNEQDEMARKIGAPVTVISEAGHCPNLDNPTLTAQVLADYWLSFS